MGVDKWQVLHTPCPEFCLRHMPMQYTMTKVSQHNFYNIHLLNVDSKFRDMEYEVRSPQESPCISIDQIISDKND